MGVRKEFDVLVVGTGIAGLSAAIAAAQVGAQVAVISKEASLDECNTRYAQGGIVATGLDDTPELLERDILAAGDGMGFRETVQLLSREGTKVVEQFLGEKVGVPFCRKEDGTIDRTKEAAHSVRRIIHVMDRTGEAVELALLNHAHTYGLITSFPSHVAIELITNTHNSSDSQERYRRTRVMGVYVFNEASGEVDVFFASVVLLATGGAGNLFLHTSNPAGATGDGIAAAHRIGAEIVNAEYIQFHPTILFHRDVKRFLISEAVRGEGARLMNRRGEYFMERYRPNDKDLAPRDEVARAIYREIELEDTGYVLLDARGIEGLDLKERFPKIFEQCMQVGIDMRTEPIPVVPAAHYFCGGVKANHQGRTSIPGLYAIGETSCTGVHGANRLASVSLLEGLYFGLRAGEDAARNLTNLSRRLTGSIPDWVYPIHEEEFDPLLIHQDFLTIQSTMWNYAGIIRTQKRLLRALADLNYLSHRIEQFYKQARITREIIELRNAVLTATLIVRAAHSNGISRGCHYVE